MGLNVAPPTQPAWDDDLIPDIDEDEHEPDELSPILDNIGILEAYTRWCGKSTPAGGKRTESIMVSCPNPAHPDHNPSAWLNTEKDVWFCGSCQEGGDKYDIAAWHFNMPGYQEPSVFPELRKRMAADFGYHITRTLGGNVVVMPPPSTNGASAPSGENPPPEPVLSHLPAPADSTSRTAPIGPSTSPAQHEPDSSSVVVSGPFGTLEVAKGFDSSLVSIPWRDIVRPGTFLYEWMAQTSLSDEPNEYLFWLGMMGLGCAAGNNVLLDDAPKIRGNLMVCLIGSSGSRKSRALGRLGDFVERVLPYDHAEEECSGTYWMPTPGSGEALVDMFSKPIYDDVNPSMVIGYAPVRGVVRFGELTELTSRSARAGNVIKPTIMDFYDRAKMISTANRKHGVVQAEHHFCQVVTTTQPKAVREIIERNDVDSGFMNRWIFAKAIEKPRQAIGARNVDLRLAEDLMSEIRAWASPRTVSYLPEGLAAATEVIEQKIFTEQDDERPMLGRLDLTFKKILLLLAVNERSAVITKTIVDQATHLLPYLIHTYDVVDRHVGFGPFEDCCDEVLDCITDFQAKMGRGPTMQQIRTRVSKRFNAELLARAAKALMSVGTVAEMMPPIKGQPPTYVKVA